MAFDPLPRHGFLRGLATLPLIGGGLTLIGQPTAAAVAVTPDLLERYSAWLAVEYGESLIELAPLRQPNKAHAALDQQWARKWCQQSGALQDPARTRFGQPPAFAPSTRAAVILSAAGVPLT